MKRANNLIPKGEKAMDMNNIVVESYVDKGLLGKTIGDMLKFSSEVLGKKDLDATDHSKMKLLRNVTGIIASGVAMAQQEIAMMRNAIVVERMKQIGYPIGGTKKKAIGAGKESGKEA